MFRKVKKKQKEKELLKPIEEQITHHRAVSNLTEVDLHEPYSLLHKRMN